MKTVETINLEYLNNFRHALNARKAAAVFCIGMDKDGKITVCATADISPMQMKEVCLKFLKGNFPAEKWPDNVESFDL